MDEGFDLNNEKSDNDDEVEMQFSCFRPASVVQDEDINLNASDEDGNGDDKQLIGSLNDSDDTQFHQPESHTRDSIDETVNQVRNQQNDCGDVNCFGDLNSNDDVNCDPSQIREHDSQAPTNAELELRQVTQNLESRLVGAEHENEALRSVVGKHAASIIALEAELARAAESHLAQVTRLETQINELTEKHAKELAQEKLNAANHEAELLSQHKSSLAELSQQSQKAKDLEMRLQTITKSSSVLTIEMGKLKSKVDEVHQSEQEAKRDVGLARHTITTLRAQIADLSSQNEIMRANITTLQGRLDTSNSKLLEHTRNEQDLTQKIVELEQKLLDSGKSCEQLKTLCDDQSTRLLETQQKLEQQQQQHQQQQAKAPEGESHPNNTDTAPQPPAVPFNTISIQTTGFHVENDSTKRAALTALVALGFGVLDESEVTPRTTHILVPNKRVRTMKTFVAAMTDRWVVTADWALACAAQQGLVPEAPFGFRTSQTPYKDKCFFFRRAFETSCASLATFARELIERHGHGRVVHAEVDADFVIVDTLAPKLTKIEIHFDDLIDMIVHSFPSTISSPLIEGSSVPAPTSAVCHVNKENVAKPEEEQQRKRKLACDDLEDAQGEGSGDQQNLQTEDSDNAFWDSVEPYSSRIVQPVKKIRTSERL
eukprot:c11073_g1_i1.p1 GENE.c11073_g1_i1~~c11073_g1_i1.p1  ORF type:complete len:669 (+),score=202.23 c11073_g1_i1:39-2009(+)